ncbi:MAG TPA: MCE family protein [Candidatus Latescibacteria bacterium]|nr:MCE family protein [Candidatus Latescibacterota bacterium]
MQRFGTEAKVGLVIFIAIALLILGLLFLSDYHLKGGGYTLRTTLENVRGLEEGDPVTVAGLKVGKILRMELKEGRVVVILWLKGNVRLPQGSVARVQSIGTLGEKSIEILSGLGPDLLKEGDTIPGRYQPGVVELATAIEQASQELRVTLSQFRSTFDERMQEDIRGSLSEIREMAREMRKAAAVNSRELEAILGNLRTTSRELSQLSGSQRERIENLIGSFEESSEALRGAATKLSRSSGYLESILGRIEKGEGTLGKLSTDDRLYNNIEALTRDLHGLVKDFRENPRKYIHLELF